MTIWAKQWGDKRGEEGIKKEQNKIGNKKEESPGVL